MNKRNAEKFSLYLDKYYCTLDKDLDQLWAELDVDFNGYLDKGEALMFVKNISECMEDKSRKENFTSEKFQTVFDQFDEDKNGFLEKAEMAVLIKNMFGKNKSQKNR